MLNKTVIVFSLLLFYAVPATVMGKDIPAGKWWQRSGMVSKLKLTEAEKDALDQKYIESRRKMIKLKNVLESENFELEVLLESEPLNESKTIEQHDRLQKARSDLANERFRFILEVRKIIGLDRFQELKMTFKKIRRIKARRMRAPEETHGRKGAGTDE
jgi:Spy/CpxP family protein refolding chaperone